MDQEQRASVIHSFGGDDAVVRELLPQNESIAARLDEPASKAPESALEDLPLDDEAHIESWTEYADESARLGVGTVLKDRLVQLRFPICEGISQTEEYRRATRRGIFPEGDSSLELTEPADLELSIHRTSVGAIPILIAGSREDFVSLVRALSARNEPVSVPDSMGACMVKGLNNWDRVARYRRRWEQEREAGAQAGTWQEEFKLLSRRKELYQDRLILLDRGAYSAIRADDVELDEPQWLDLSLRIRREHECCHYFTLRLFGSMKSCVLDELVADTAGIVGASGAYSGDLALRFLGLESFPEYRQGARLENYRGEPALSDRGFEVQSHLVYSSIRNLEAFFQKFPKQVQSLQEDGRVLAGLCRLSLEEFATPGMSELLLAACSSTGRSAA